MLKTSGEFLGFDQAGEGASGNGVPVGTVLLASDPQSAPSWEAEAQRQDLNPGKARALPSPVGCLACLPPRSSSGRCPLIWGKLPGRDKTLPPRACPTQAGALLFQTVRLPRWPCSAQDWLIVG